MTNRILLLPLLACALSTASAQQVVWQINGSGNSPVLTPTVTGEMEVTIAGNGSLLSSNALPTDLVAVLASPNVQFATANVRLGDFFSSSLLQDNVLPGELTFASSAGSVFDWEVNATANALMDDYAVFPPSSLAYVSAFSYDATTPGAPDGLSQTVYPASSFSIEVPGYLFQSTTAPTITIKDNPGQDFFKITAATEFSSPFEFDSGVQNYQMEVRYAPDAIGVPGLSVLVYPLDSFDVTIDGQQFATLPGGTLTVKDNPGQDFVKFDAFLPSIAGLNGRVEFTIAGNGSLLPSMAIPPDLATVLASPHVQFTVARVSYDNAGVLYCQFDGDLQPGELTMQPRPTPDLCSGDGGDQLGCTNCPCMNNAPMGTIGGCLNSANTSARLEATGDLSVSLPSMDTSDLRFALAGAPSGAFCILNSGDGVAPGNMVNPCFGLSSGAQALQFDGLRCAITNTRRHGGRSADSNGDVGVTNSPWGGEGGPPVGIAVAGGGFVSGQTRYFQVINRDDPLASCMRGLNTSQAIEITFTP